MVGGGGGAPRHRCDFASADVTQPLSHPANAPLARALGGGGGGRRPGDAQGGGGGDGGPPAPPPPTLFIASYVVAENARALRATRFAFFRALVARAPRGSLFVFAETTHRLWPELLATAFEVADGGGDGEEEEQDGGGDAAPARAVDAEEEQDGGANAEPARGVGGEEEQDGGGDAAPARRGVGALVFLARQRGGTRPPPPRRRKRGTTPREPTTPAWPRCRGLRLLSSASTSRSLASRASAATSCAS